MPNVPSPSLPLLAVRALASVSYTHLDVYKRQGVLQLNAALEHGYWFARSAEFMNRPIIDMLVWMRMPGDLVFSAGALLLALFVARKWLKPSLSK